MIWPGSAIESIMSCTYLKSISYRGVFQGNCGQPVEHFLEYGEKQG